MTVLRPVLPFKKSQILETKGTKELHTESRSSSIRIPFSFSNLSRGEDRKSEALNSSLASKGKKGDRSG
jgi:hypothetical protein